MKRTRVLLPAALLAAALLGTSCSSHQVQPDVIGLWYSAGSWDGQSFKKIVKPGDVEWFMNDNLYRLTIAQRSFIVRKDEKADVNGVISVPAGGTAETSGTLVDFEVSVAFKLNTRDNDINGFDGGTVRKFFEDLCRHYGCQLNDDGNDTDGWKRLLLEKLYPPLESAFKDEARRFDADAIVNNAAISGTERKDDKGQPIPGTAVGTLTLLQAEVGQRFQEYLERQTGQQYFCGPAFNRDVPGDPKATDPKAKPCPPVELLIISADYNDPRIRDARNEKKIAVDKSVAQEQLARALADPNYLEYLRIQAANECAKSNGAICILSFGGDNVPVAVGVQPR